MNPTEGYHIRPSERISRVHLTPRRVWGHHICRMLLITGPLRVEHVARVTRADGAAVRRHVEAAGVGQRVAIGVDHSVLDAADEAQITGDREV